MGSFSERVHSLSIHNAWPSSKKKVKCAISPAFAVKIYKNKVIALEDIVCCIYIQTYICMACSSKKHKKNIKRNNTRNTNKTVENLHLYKRSGTYSGFTIHTYILRSKPSIFNYDNFFFFLIIILFFNSNKKKLSHLIRAFLYYSFYIGKVRILGEIAPKLEWEFK